MRHGTILGWSVVAAVAVGSPALAQQQKRLEAQLSARVVYDDNVSRSNATVAALRNIEQEDVLFSPNLSVDIMQPVGRQAVFLTGNVGYDFYDKNDKLDRERIALRGGAIGVLGPCVSTATGGYSRQQSELEDLQLGVTENAETVTTVSLDLACGRQVGFVPTASVSQEWAENSAAQRSTSDYDTIGGVVGLAYRRPNFGELSIFGNFSKTEYDRYFPIGTGLERDGYETSGAGIRFTRRIGARLQGAASAGYTWVNPMASNADSFNGVTYGVDLTYRPSGKLEATGAFARSVKPSNRLQTTYGVEDNYSIQLSYLIGTRLRAGLGGSYTESSYEGAALVNGVSITEEQTSAIFASLRFDISRRFSVVLDARQQERDANVHGVDYTANRFGLAVVAKY